MLKGADEIGVVLKFAGDDARRGEIIFALRAEPIEISIDELDERRLRADAAADGEALRIEKHLEVENLDGDLPSEAFEAIDGGGIVLLDGVKKNFAADIFDGAIFFLSVAFEELRDAALEAQKIFVGGSAVEIGDGERDFAGGEMSAAMNFVILDESAADRCAEDQNKAVVDVGERSDGGFGERGAFCVILDGDLDGDFRLKSVDDAEPVVILEGAAGDAHSVDGVDDAGHGQCNAFGVRIRPVNVDDGIDEVAAIGFGSRHLAALDDI